jgi:hypothetical protein
LHITRFRHTRGDEWFPVRHLPDHRHAFRCGSRLRGGDGVTQDVRNRHLLQDEVEGAGVDAGEFEEVVHHVRQPVRLRANALVVAVDRRRVVDDAVLECLSHCPDPGKRRAEVVAHPGDQLTPTAFKGSLPLARVLEPDAHLGQLPVEFGKLCRQRHLGRAVGAVAQSCAGKSERPAAGDHPPSQHQSGRDRDRSRDDRDDEQDHEVVSGEEHRRACRQCSHEYRGDGNHRDEHQRQVQTSATGGAQEPQTPSGHSQRRTAGYGDDDDEVGERDHEASS